MTLLTHLPFELQLLILDQIKRENHLDLAPISQTCKHFSSLVADRFNWTQTVTILEPLDVKTTPSKYYLYKAAEKNNHLITSNLQANVHNGPSISVVLSILGNQQRENTLQSINLLMPNKHQHKLYHTLGKYPQTNIRELSVRDPADDGYIMAAPSQHHKFISGTLSKSQATLTRLDLPSFPCCLLLASDALIFPRVTYLHVALAGHDNDTWRQLKRVFPALIELRITLDREHLALFKLLLRDIPLFPWIKRLTIQSAECPKTYFTREELKNSLLELHGLNRITAGWDMIALS